MKCDIIRDLLPSYIENLTSESSNEEIEKHLADCEECRLFYQEMTGEVKENIPVTEVKELDYLKKIRKNYIRRAAITVGTIAVILVILVSLFAVGFSVASQDIDMTYVVKDNHLEINFQLKNGHDLLSPKSKAEFIYDDNHKVIGVEYYYKPVWVFDNPFDDVGSSFSLGTELPNPEDKGGFTNTIIIEYSDKTVKFVNGKLIE
ncbi:zf-HC2 domain-containing protein [Dehalobacter sp. DCM]|uniref:zf-HC2 domain-containing protein n=1 Tax=Dehalobacter sp. DCM TaxID=2907827 RepID=UPI003081BFC1|nr:zf-HC2 domain-containing protein [Dehalobacter sp. DCM]